MRALLRAAFICSVVFSTYEVNYFDCSHPTKIRAYSLHTACKAMEPAKVASQRYALLQRTFKAVYKGFTCRVTRSTLWLSCRVWSHESFLKPPDYGMPVPLSVQQCEQIRDTNYYSTPDGVKHVVAFNSINVYESIDAGELTLDSGSTYCRGIDKKVGNLIQNSVLELSQYKVEIHESTFEVSGNQVDVPSDHITLTCQANEGACVTAFATYVWAMPQRPCDLEKIREVDMIPAGQTHLVDLSSHIYLEQLGVTASWPQCPRASLIATNYLHLYLSKRLVGWAPLSPGNLEIEIELESALDFENYRIEKLLHEKTDKLSFTVCQNRHTLHSTKITLYSNDTFAKSKGEILYLFKCTAKKGLVKNSKICYEDVPLEDGGFMDLETRVYTKYSSETLCTRNFPSIIQTNKGWISLTGEINPVSKPADLEQISASSFDTSTDHLSGVYTKSEVADWNRWLEHHTYSRALLNNLAMSQCVVDDCSPGTVQSVTPLYDMSLLRHQLEMKLNQLDPSKAFWEWIGRYGGVCSLIVLLLELCRVFSYIILFCYTGIREGPRGAISCVLLLCLPGTEAVAKVRDRGKAYKRETDRSLPLLTRKRSTESGSGEGAKA